MSKVTAQMSNIEVYVDESWERWTEFNLSDGSTIRAKVVINSIYRLPDHDPVGKPLYQPNFSIIAIVTDFPPHLGPTEH